MFPESQDAPAKGHAEGPLASAHTTIPTARMAEHLLHGVPLGQLVEQDYLTASGGLVLIGKAAVLKGPRRCPLGSLLSV